MFCPDNADFNINSSEGLKGGNKKNCCFYCQKIQSKIARHLAIVHRNEPEVKKFLALHPNNLERKRIIETIRRNDNFVYIILIVMLMTENLLCAGALKEISKKAQKIMQNARDFL